VQVVAPLGGLFLLALGVVLILGRRKIAPNLPAASKPSFRDFPRKDSPGSVAALGAISVALGLFLIGFYVFLIS
jgi:hypothetical protein